MVAELRTKDPAQVLDDNPLPDKQLSEILAGPRDYWTSPRRGVLRDAIDHRIGERAAARKFACEANGWAYFINLLLELAMEADATVDTSKI